VFIIVSAGMLNGSQNERVRRFSNLKHIEFWKFERDLFNVHNICILAQYGHENIQKKYRILVKTKHISENSHFKTKFTKHYIPTYIRIGEKFLPLNEILKEPKLEEWGIGRFVPEQKKTLTVTKSVYHDEFRQGACIGPRNLLFVTPVSTTDGTDNTRWIYPDSLVKSKKYGGWDYTAYKGAQIEKEYIHYVAKSTNLVPFVLLQLKSVFLPFTRDFSNVELLEGRKYPLTHSEIDDLFKNHPNAKSHYTFLHTLYSKKKKSGSAIPDLFLNMNYNNKLLQENQRKTRKILYNGIGSKVKAAYLKIDALIDSSLYYFIPNSDMEAYYLMGILNSPTITTFTVNMGSTGAGGSLRNIHKNPLKCNILHYQGTSEQKLVAKLSRNIENYVQRFCVDSIQKNFQNALEREFCQFCGRFIDEKNLPKHQNSCKTELNLTYIKKIFENITPNDKMTLSNKEILKGIILGHPIPIEDSLQETARILLGYVIKPKTLQNRLRKDKIYLKKLNILDVAVKSLWK
jgi:hypothetical protein